MQATLLSVSDGVAQIHLTGKIATLPSKKPPQPPAPERSAQIVLTTESEAAFDGNISINLDTGATVSAKVTMDVTNDVSDGRTPTQVTAQGQTMWTLVE
ncbi:hypothetical protein BH11ARM2_BH11ARM2_20950 [soil metagenome]